MGSASSGCTQHALLNEIRRATKGTLVDVDLERQRSAEIVSQGGPSTPVEGLLLYIDQLLRWNMRMNLVGAQHWQDVVRDLLLDSLFLAPFLVSLQQRKLLPEAPLSWDLGSGAGLPGIPLRLVWEEGEYWLVEARQKRSIFLADCISRLHLAQTWAFRGRAEAFFAQQAKAPDLIVSRAFMPWPELLPFVAPVIRTGTCLIILANTPPPKEFPAPWQLCATETYPSGTSERFFWALTFDAVS